MLLQLEVMYVVSHLVVEKLLLNMYWHSSTMWVVRPQISSHLASYFKVY